MPSCSLLKYCTSSSAVRMRLKNISIKKTSSLQYFHCHYCFLILPVSKSIIYRQISPECLHLYSSQSCWKWCFMIYQSQFYFPLAYFLLQERHPRSLCVLNPLNKKQFSDIGTPLPKRVRRVNRRKTYFPYNI